MDADEVHELDHQAIASAVRTGHPAEMIARMAVHKTHGSPTFNPKARKWLFAIGVIGLLITVIRFLVRV